MSGIINSGKFNFSSVSGTEFSGATPQYSYCQESSVTGTSYPTNSNDLSNTNVHDFGFRANGIIVSNEGAADICYVFKILYGVLNSSNQVDSGIVKAGQTVILSNLVGHGGLMVRSRTAATNNYIVSAY